MKILLTGAAGFIGSHLAERLCARGDDVVGFDNFDAFYPRVVKERNLAGLRARPNFALVEGDLTAPGDLERAFTAAGGKVDLVVHLAALAGVRPSLAQPVRYADVNVTGTVNVFDACRKRDVGKVVFASSSSVYGADSVVPFREDDRCARPLSPYAATKRAGEMMAHAEHHVHGTGITCLRFFTVYGPRQRPDLAIHKFTRSIAMGKQIELFGDGSTSRDYTWIDDIIDGVVASVDQVARESRGHFRVYNLGGSKTTTLRGLVDMIAAALGKTPLVAWKAEQPGDMKHTHADVSLAGRELGYAPKVEISQGIERFVRWWCSEHGPELKALGLKVPTLPYHAPEPR
ncbi:MAG: SDR family NAD(P)-dependent oxidoreductase [Myxococcales bacterium]|nr:SDR family NAD(P)-dependent oxidoreductase [Myxococcales bacterium]